jgi:hypothetical protein
MDGLGTTRAALSYTHESGGIGLVAGPGARAGARADAIAYRTATNMRLMGLVWLQHGRQGFDVRRSPPDTVLRGNERHFNNVVKRTSVLLRAGWWWASTSVHRFEASVVFGGRGFYGERLDSFAGGSVESPYTHMRL